MGNLDQKRFSLSFTGKLEKNWHFCLYKENTVFLGHFHYQTKTNNNPNREQISHLGFLMILYLYIIHIVEGVFN